MNSSQGDLLRVENLAITFQLQSGPLEVVKDISFRVQPGKTVAIVGESGSGKSVTAQALMGILPSNAKITAGSILFNDPDNSDPPLDIAKLDVDGAQMQNLRGGRIAMIFQEPASSLSPLHTIGNQIQEALALHHQIEKSERRSATEKMLSLVGFRNAGQAYDMYPFELSGGLSQRAMIAMALICRPALLIADEPTTALDVTIQAQILKLLKDLQQTFDMAILLITHDLGVVANMADEVVVVYHGQVMEAGSLNDIFTKPEHPYLKALMQAVPHFNMEPGERLKPLREVKVSKTAAQTVIAEDDNQLVLQVKNLSKSFSTRNSGSIISRTEASKTLAVDNVSFEIRQGECFGLVGESGCGKTTVSKLLTRALTADAGSMVFRHNGNATDIATLKGSQLRDYRTRVQMIFQDPFSSLSPRMTVANILTEPLEIHNIGTDASRLQKACELMELVGLDPRFLSRYPHSFSGGQRQRIGIARALALEPELLICDEPVSALDVSVQAQVLNLLKDLQKQLGLTFLFISHNLAVVNYMADRIAVMCNGSIVETAPRQKLFARPVHSYTRALLAAVPYPDLKQQLDFAVTFEGASTASHWEQAFQPDQGEPLRQIEISPQHFVLARRDFANSEASR